jgi:dienelactone hydrolase
VNSPDVLLSGSPLYRQVNELVFELYSRGQFRAALRIIEEHRTALSTWHAELALLAACLHCRLGAPHLGLQELLEASARGGWWNPQVLGGDDDLTLLRSTATFAALMATSASRWRTANARADRSGDVLIETDRPRHLIVALHAAEEDADDAAQAWRPVADATGSTLLAVRSSQRTSPADRTWTDPRKSVREVYAALTRLAPATRELPVVAAGFAAGGRVALQWALEGRPVRVAGVLAVAPAFALPDLARQRVARIPWGRVWVGAEDELRAQVEGARFRLAAAGVGVEVVPGLGHAIPEDLPERAAQAMAEPAGVSVLARPGSKR